MNPNGNITVLTIRPFLRQLLRSATGMHNEVHQFNYYNINGLPSRLSFAQDYWGYFNGVNNNYLIPASPNPNTALKYPATMANRAPNGNYAYYGLLSKITYPTGGADSLQYEANTVYESRTALPPITSVTKTAAGTGIHDAVIVSYAFQPYGAQNVSISASCVYMDILEHVDPPVMIFNFGLQ